MILEKLGAIAWARRAAREIIENHGNQAAIDTANYRECGFIMAATKLALEDAGVAARIGQMIESPRIIDEEEDA